MGLVYLARPRNASLPPAPVLVTPGRVDVRELPSAQPPTPQRKKRNVRPLTVEEQQKAAKIAPPEPPIVVEDSQIKKSFASDGMTLTTLGGSLTVGVRDVRFGGRPLPAGALISGVNPRASQENPGEVVYDRGAVTEKYIPRGQKMEQWIVLGPSLEPLKKQGELTISVGFEGGLDPVLQTKDDAGNPEQPRQIVAFKRPDGGQVFSCGGAVAIDAAGRKRALKYEVDKGHLQMTLDAAFVAEAAFPLTIDPLFGADFALDFSGANLHEPDVAFSPTANCWLVVFERNAVGNGDIYCKVVDANGNMYPPENYNFFILDQTTADSRLPRVARSNTNQFMLVWQEKPSGGTKWEIRGQLLTVSANTPTLQGGKFPIYIGTNDSTNPDIGYNASQNTYLVSWSYVYSPGPPIDQDIYVQAWKTTGSSDGSIFAAANSTAFEESSTVVPFCTQNQHGLAYVYRSIPGAQGDIYTRWINMQTKGFSAQVAVANTSDDEANPDLSSTNPNVGYITWSKQTAGFSADIMARKIDFGGATLVMGSTFAVENSAAHTVRPHCDAAMNADGDRVIFTYSRNPSFPITANGWNIEAKVYNRAFDPPLLIEVLNLSTNASAPSFKDDDNARCAVNPANSVVLVAWENVYSASDYDLWAQRVAMVPVAGINVNPTSGIYTYENGTTAQFTIALTKAPTANVTIPLSYSGPAPAEASVSPPSVTFTPANWNIPQIVTVTGLQDTFYDGARSYQIVTGNAISSDGAYSGMNGPDVSLYNYDDDFPDILTSPTSGLVTDEGGAGDSFTVRLASTPFDVVTIPVTVSDSAEATIATSTVLTFDASNWNIPQTVSLKGLDDFVVDGDITYFITTGPASSFGDFYYDGLYGADVYAVNKDNDTASFDLGPVSGLLTSEAGGTAQFSVALTSQPSGDVTFTLFSNNTAEGTVSPTTITFTPLNWMFYQTVIVTGVDDLLADGNVGYAVITNPATSTDPLYNNLNPPDVSVTNLNNDTAGITVTPTSGLTTTEGGGTATFTIKLNSQPTANVTIGLSSSNSSEGVVSPASLVFTPANYGSPQTVTVTGVEDLVADGPKLYTIVTAPATSTDTTGYSGMNASDVTVTNQDNDTAGIIVNPQAGLITTEAGGTATFTVRLNSQPTANVTIGISSNTTSEGNPFPTSLTFTAANWNVSQTVTVTGADDQVADGPKGYTIVTAPASSADLVYNTMDAADVSVTNNDNDTIGFIVNPTTGLLTTELGGTATFTIKLNSQPTGSVTIGLSSNDTTEGTVSPASVTFTPANWSVNQTVTVTGQDDLMADGLQAYSIVTAAATGTDTSGYIGQNPTDVSVINSDNDAVGFTVTPVSGLVTTEAGGTASFTIKLNSQPTATVTIGLSSNNTAEGTVSPASVTFTSVNWNTAQTVTVTGVDDAVMDGGIGYSIVTAPASSTDPGYNLQNPSDVSVTNSDNDVAGFTATPTSGLITTEAGGTATFTVKLNSQPTANVTIGAASNNTAEGVSSPPSLTFTPANWNTPQTVTVTGQNDFVVDGDVAYLVVPGAATSLDPNYNGLSPAGSISVTNQDNDVAGFTVTPTSGLTTTEAGATATFTVKLTSQPSANVSINVSSSSTAEGVVAPTSLTFTPANWSTNQTVTITGVDDLVDDGDKLYTIVLSPATSTDGNYSGRDPSDVSVTNIDNDTAGITVSPVAGLSTTEAGGTATFGIRLNSQPTANVTINVSSSNTAEGTVSPSSVTFTTANWSTFQNITVTGRDDLIADANVGYTIVTAPAVSADGIYNTMDASDVSVTNLNDDIAGFTMTPAGGLVTTEAGGTATFTVKLSSQPTASVTLGLSSNNTAEGTVSPSSVTFTTANWNIAQTVTVTGVDDLVADGNVGYFVVTAAATSTDASYGGLNPADVSVTNNDNDAVGFTVTPQSGLITTEAAGTASFTIKLNSQPTGNVTINLSSNNTGEGTVSPASLVFTTVNWNTAQTVTVTGVDDFVADGNVGYTIVTAPAVSGDLGYNGQNPSDVTVTNNDNDAVGFTVTPVAGLVTTEAGGTATFTIRLNSQPTNSVTIGLSSNNTGEGTVSPASLVFTTANWSTPQTVTVTGVDDPSVDGNVGYTIVTAAATSADLGYSGQNPSDVSVTNNDNDSAGFTVNPISGLTTTEAGGTATFTVKLTSQPSANVTINLSSSNPGEGSVSPASLTFTSANWNVNQTVTVTGVNDDVDDGDKLYTIVLAPATSTDGNYSGRDPADVSVTNVDNDAAGFTVNPTSGLITTEAGGTASFTIRLNSQPTANVTINLSSNNTAEGTVSPSSVTFTVANWSVNQTVTVTGVDDLVADGNIAYTIVTAVATSSDGTYNGLDPANVSATNNDNDAVGFTVTPTAGLITTEAGGTATFTIKLNSQPTNNVTIGLSSNDTTEGTVSPASVVFTSANWNVAQTVTVAGVDDLTADGNVGYTIVTAAAVSSDPGYSGQNPSDVSVTNNDDDAVGFTVTPTSGLVTTEAGGTATFTIRLNSQPLSSVTINLSSNNTLEGTVSPASVVFSTLNWSTPQTVTVTGVDDAVADGNIAYTIVTAPASSLDLGYSGQNPADVSVTNNNDDTVGFTVTPTSGLITTEAGGTATFTVKLNSQPTNNVTIGLSSNNTLEGTVSPASLIFTPANWSTAQTVTVTGVDDPAVDGNVGYTILTAAATSADLSYSGQDPANVSVTNNDDDVAGFTVNPTSALTTTEAGGTATFTVKLTSQPSANVTINLSSSNSGEGTVSPTSLTFTSANWNTNQTVTVTGVNDDVDDGDKLYTIVTAPATSADGNYSGRDASDVTVTNVDNDAAGFTVNPTSGLITTEAGGTATFTIKLTSQPTANVTVNLSSNNPAEGTVSPSSVTFTPANWNVNQTVTVTGVDDLVADGNVGYSIATAPAVSADGIYNGLDPANVSVTNNNDDTVGFTVTPTSGLVTTEAGGTATFTIKLNTQPTGTVTIGLSSNDTTEGTVLPASVSFTAVNWSTPQTVTVTGVNDDLADGNILYTIVTGAATGTDTSGYVGQNPADVTVTNNDNDAVGFTVTPVAGLVTTEAGGTATFTIKLNSQPTNSVTIGLSSNNTLEGTVSPASLVFTTVNWNTPQTVTVTGVDDPSVDGNVGYTIVTAAATSADLGYNGQDPADVSVTNNDNDVRGFTVAPLSGLVTTEAGGTASFTVKLTSQPSANVTIPVSSSNTAEGSVSTPTLTFTPGNWNVNQTVTVTGVNDLAVDGDVGYTIVLGVAGGLDAGYAGLNPSDVSVTNQDNDVAGVSVSPTLGLTTSEAGATATFTIVLNTLPSANVSINLSSSNTAEGTVSPASVTFTPGNWNVAQTVTVTGADDFVVDGAKGYTIVTAAANSTDSNYNGLNASDVSVTNTDNDTAGFVVSPVAGLVTTESGLTATFTVRLTSQPIADVVIGLSSDTTTEGTVAPASLTFTPANWNVNQTVTVTGVNDNVDDGDKLYNIVTAPAVSADPVYDPPALPGLDPPNVAVTNQDNDVAGYVVTPTTGLVTTESGGTATFTVRLTSQPTADVTINLSSDNTAEGTVSPASVTFTPGNWNVNQTVTVTGVDDGAIIDTNVVYNIITSLPTTSDTLYQVLNPPDVEVTNNDNDAAGFTVTPQTGLVTTEAGGTATFTVKLNTPPTATVQINLTSSNTAEGTVLPASITFTAGVGGNWNVPQVITVTGVNDFEHDGDTVYTIFTSAPITTDVNYSALNPPDVSVTNLDDDVASITVSPTSGLTTTEAAGTATFTVVLTSKPTADVTIPLSSNNTAEGTVSPASLTFTTANWNVAQTVTITGVDDQVDDGDILYAVVTGAAVSTDTTGYSGLDAANVSVTNTDNDTAGFTVAPTSGLVTTEAGGTATFTVQLNSKPLADVVVGLSSSNAVEGTVSPTTLTFTTANWNVPQTVTVTGVDDAVADGNIAYTITTAPATSADPVYSGLNPADVSVTNNNDDAVGFVVSPVVGLVTTEAGGTATFTVKLNSRPTADVIIGLSSSSTAEGVVFPASLTFTPANWNVNQAVLVTGVDDFVDDGNQPYTIVTALASSVDGGYNGQKPPDVSVTNTDDDTKGIVVSPIAGLQTTEAGATATFTVKLASQPLANVTIALSSSNTAEGTVAPASLIFTSVNWDIAQTVTVTGINDFVADGDKPYTIQTAAAVSTDPAYSGVNASDVSVTNLDDDLAGIVVSPQAGLVTTEAGGTSTFTIVLTSQPTVDVTIPLSSNNTGEGTVSPASLTFTTANWSVAQTVTVTGVNDAVADGPKLYTIVTGLAVSGDANYSVINPSDVSVTNTDNDAVGFTVSPLAGLVTTEAGTTATFTIRLNSQPTADVTISLSSSDPTEGTVSPLSVTFTSANWNVDQTVTVTGVDDSVVDGPSPYTIVTAPAVSADTGYSGQNPADVSVTNNDNDVVGFTVAPTSGLITTEAGGTATFTIKLNSQPTADVTIGLSSSDTAEATVSPASVTFTSGNWNVAQTVTVTGVDDASADGSKAFTIFTAPAVSTDTGYSGQNPSDVTGNNNDNDAVGFTVTPVSGLITTEAGGTATFTIRLNSQPTANVTIGLSSSDTSEGTVAPASLTFTTANWSVPQTVTVTGVDDLMADGNVGYTILTAAAVSGDGAYSGQNPADVSVTNNDNDTFGFTVTPNSGLITTEAGGTASFTVRLNSQPTADVLIGISSNNTAEGVAAPASLTFTSANWSVAQTVTVTGVDDAVADGAKLYSIVTAAALSADLVYNGQNPADVTVTNTDNDVVGIQVTPTGGLVTTESGGTATFAVRLASQPTQDVVIGLSSSDTTEGTVSPASLTFTTANWNVDQTVTVTGVDDLGADGNIVYTIVTAAALSTDPSYAGQNAADVSVTNLDNDAVGFVVSPVAGLTTTEAGGTATFTIRLGSQPTANVTIALSSSNPSEGTVSPVSVTFTTANWNVDQTVTVTGVDDAVADGPQLYSIVTALAASADPGYNGQNPADVSVTNTDNDIVGFTVAPTLGLSTSEAGTTATFTIRLNTQPTSDVTIALSSSDTAEATVSPASVTFTPANWNILQTVTATGVDDAVADGNKPFTIVTAPAVSTDTGYNGQNPSDVTGTNNDNDVVGFTVSPVAGLVTTEAGGTATFTVRLNTQPTLDVVIGLSSSDTTEGTVAPASLTFTSANWSVPQTVTVTGVDDLMADGNIGYTILTAAAVSGDPNYNGQNPADVSVTNNDNDTFGFTVAPTSGLITTEAGGTATFTVHLNSQPTADVVIAISSNNSAEGVAVPASLTFTSANWSVAQTVTVTGVDDAVADGPQLYTIVTAAAVSGDPVYNGQNPADVTVTNTDNDVVGIQVTPTSGLITTEAGTTASFTIRLNSQPTQDVTIALSSSDTTEGTVSPASVTFTSANWNVNQTVTVTGVDDLMADGNVAYSIVTAAAVSADASYAGQNAADVSVTNTDNDAIGITVTPTSGLTTTEAGGTASFTVKLNSQPTANVTIALSSSNPSEGTVSPASLTFTTANWNVDQTVTVTGVDDAVVDGSVAYTILSAPAVSTDSGYSGQNPSDVSVTNTDNDVVGFTVAPTSGLSTSEAGTTATFTVRLNSQPTADVTIALSSSDTAEATVSPASLTFTPSNWNVLQTVTATGVDDAIADGSKPFTVVTAAAVSTDTGYNGQNPSDVTGTNSDNDSVGFTVNPLAGLVTTEAGGTATFTVRLNTQPLADVVIGISSNNTAEGTVLPLSLTFTSVNWATPQTVTVTGVDDAVADGNKGYTIVTAAAVSADPSYSGQNPADVTVTNNDNDVAGFVVSPTSGLTTTEAGGTASFQVHLTSQPTADVVIGISSNNTAEGSAAPATLTFTSVNWAVPQNVTVTGVDEFIADGNKLYTIVTGAAVSADPVYNTMNPADVTVTNTDDDVVGFTVAPTSGLVTTEAGGTASFTVRLTSQPTVNVTVNLSSSNTAEGNVAPASLIFTPANWNVAQAVTVTGVDDFVVDGNVVYTIVTAPAVSGDAGYSGQNPADVTATNNDDDVAGFAVSPASGLITTEAGGTATFTVKLTSQPAANVTVALSSSNPAEGTVSPTSLVFTAANWNVAQTVTVTGVDDSVADGNVAYSIFTAPATSTDPNYAGKDAADVSVTNSDNDVVGFTVTPSSGLVTTEGGGTATFTVRLNSQPTGDVTVGLTSSDTAEGTVSPSALTFTSGNWNTPQTVTVTGIDDAIADGSKGYSVVTAAAVSADPNYSGQNPTDVTVTNSDNDVVGFTVTPTSGLTTTEAGGTASFTVKLNSQPTANVSIGLSSGTPAEGTVLPVSLTFTPGNWNVDQTVTVTGVDDFVIDGNIAYTIITAPATSTDPLYSGLNPPDVTVTNNDNDAAAINVTPTSGLVTSEAGSSATFTIVLSTIPTANVTITVTSSNTAEGTVSPPSLTFTPANAMTPQNVTISGKDDVIVDGPVAYTIVTSAAISTDVNYNGLNPADVSVVNQDNDFAGVTVTPLAGLITTEAGGTASFTVALASNPTANVTITLSSSNTAEGTVSPTTLTFTSANGTTPQSVTVTGVNDSIVDGSVGYTIVTSVTSSTDTNYNNLPVPDVSVTNQDNDVAGFAITPTAGLVTTELGGTATFLVALTAVPTANVTISLSSSNTAEGTVSPATLTFTPANALTAQTVTVTGADDTLVDGNASYTILTGVSTSADPAFDGIDPADVAITNNDNDAYGFTVTPTTGLFTTEYGKTATFTVRLNSTPSADVVINLSSTDTAEGIVSPAILTFTPANATTPQTVTVTGVDDGATDGNKAYSIVTAPAASSDPNYNGLNPADVSLTNLDNEAADVTVTPTSGLITTEAGGTASFTLVLNRIPSSNVTITLTTSNPAEGTVSPASVTFTPANAQTPQTVTVTGRDDALTDGDVTYTVVTGAASSSDGSYSGLSVSDVSVLNLDDEPVVPPRIGLSAVSMIFSATQGAANPASQSMSVTNSGGGTLDWSSSTGVSWLIITPPSGSVTPGVQQFMTVAADIAGLTPGVYTTQVVISDPLSSNNPQQVPVTLTILPPPPSVTITTPAVDPFITTSSPALFGGDASPGTTSVTWSNSATGQSGAATGTTSWVANIPLIGGNNFITVYAWNSGGAGSASLTVVFNTDSVAPSVLVTFPSLLPAFGASATPLTIAGTASDDTAVTSVAWFNQTTGTSGLATGTTSWIASVPLANGSNQIMVLASDAAGNTASQTVNVTYSSPVDSGLPLIAIVVPTTAPTFGATATPLTLAGTAADSVGIAKVTWWNATTGGRGVATGTTSWSADIPLAGGGNFIAVTAQDPSGNTATAILLVSYVPTPGDDVAPYLVITTPTTLPTVSTGVPAVQMAGLAADDVALNTVVWGNGATGESGTATGLSSWTTQMTLLAGNNPVTMTAYDTSGNKTAKQLDVTYVPPVYVPPPVHIKAGACGLTGVECLLTLALAWGLRRGIRRSRKGAPK